MTSGLMKPPGSVFFPNGTCDELTLILLSDRGEQRAVLLEVTTSLAMVENDTSKLLRR